MTKYGATGDPSTRAQAVDLNTPLARKLQRFVRLDDDDRQRLAVALLPARQIAAHVDILQEGDDPRAVNVVLDGWACRYRNLPNGHRQIVSLLLPGDPCDLQVFRQPSVQHAVGTLTPVTLAQIPGAAVKKLMADSAALEEAFFRERLSATAIQHEWTVSLGRRSAIERIAHLFCEIHARLDVVGLTDGATCSMLMTQNDMADCVGQTAVHINRTLQELRSMELITLRSRRLTILDRLRLEALAMFEPGYVADDAPARPEAD